MPNFQINATELDANVALTNKQWSHYFHFLTGTKFYVDGPAGYNGNGRVLENSSDQLTLRIDINAWGPAPALHAFIAVTYLQEGFGNKAEIAEDGKEPQKDDNAEIYSDERRRERRVSIKSGGKTVVFSVRPESRDEIDFDVNFDGQSYDFDLERR